MNWGKLGVKMWTTAFAAVLLAAPLVRADDAKQLFDSLYGPKIRDVRKTLSRDDDVALAKEMVDLARKNTSQISLVTLLCDAASDLGKRQPSGYAAAVEAMELLIEYVPAQREATRDQLVLLLTRQSASRDETERKAAAQKLVGVYTKAGDAKTSEQAFAEAAAHYRRAYSIARQKQVEGAEAVQAKLELAVTRDKATKQIARLEQNLLKNVNDTDAAKQLIELHVVKMDDPKSALPYLDRAKDESLNKLVRLAAGQTDNAAATDHIALAEWYQSNAGTGKAANPIALQHAKHHATVSLNHPNANTLVKIKAQAMIKDLSAALVGSSPLPQTQTKTVDILKQLGSITSTASLPWYINNDVLTIKKTIYWKTIRTAVAPKGSYSIVTEFSLADGKGSLKFQLPIGQYRVLTNMNASGDFSLTSSPGANQNSKLRSSWKTAPLIKGKRYRLEAVVKFERGKAAAALFLDGKLMVNWAGDPKTLVIKSGWKSGKTDVVALGYVNVSHQIHSMIYRDQSK